jgi:hypothetical protein
MLHLVRPPSPDQLLSNIEEEEKVGRFLFEGRQKTAPGDKKSPHCFKTKILL